MNHELMYPRQKIISYFASYGGLTGTFVLVVMAMVYIVAKGSIEDMFSLTANAVITDMVLSLLNMSIQFVLSMLTMSVFGSVIGLIPAAVTGFWVANLQLTKSTNKIYGKLFLIGALFSLIYGIVMYWLLIKPNQMTLSDIETWQDVFLFGAVFAFIGGTSATVIGKFCLPNDLVTEKAFLCR